MLISNNSTNKLHEQIGVLVMKTHISSPVLPTVSIAAVKKADSSADHNSDNKSKHTIVLHFS